MYKKRYLVSLLAVAALGIFFDGGAPLEAKRIAVIFGSNYKGNDAGIPELELCETDAALMQQTLKAKGRYDDARVLLGQMVTASRVKETMNAVAASSTKEDVVFFYFSGHGTYQRDANSPNGLRNYIVMFNRPHVSDKELSDWMSGIKAKIVFVFDACFSGGIVQKGRRGVGDVPMAQNSPGTVIENGDQNFYFKDAVLIGSSDSNETSIEIRGSINHGIFTYYFAQGLDPTNGDMNKDGTVTLYEAFTWSQQRVVEGAAKFNHPQHPQIRGNASGYLVSGNFNPVTPQPQPQPTKPEDHLPQPDISPQKPPENPVKPNDPVTPSEPTVVDTGPQNEGSVVLCTTVLKSRQGGKTTLDPYEIMRQNKVGDVDRKVRVLLSGKEYPTKVEWLDEAQFAARCGETIPLGVYTHNQVTYKNKVALLTVQKVPAGVQEIQLEADDYPVIREVVGVEKGQPKKAFIVASLAGYGTIRGKVFYKNFEQPMPGTEVWMPSVTGVNVVYKMKTTTDGSFWFLNLPPSNYYYIKASFLESLDLDNKQLEVKAGGVTKVDVVLNRKSVKG